jgi:hypothetical protein
MGCAKRIDTEVGPLVRAPEITIGPGLGHEHQLGNATADGHPVEVLLARAPGLTQCDQPGAIGSQAHIVEVNRGRRCHELRGSAPLECLAINLQDLCPSRKENHPAGVGCPSKWNIAVVIRRQSAGVNNAVSVVLEFSDENGVVMRAAQELEVLSIRGST